MVLMILISLLHSCGKKNPSSDGPPNESVELPFQWNGLSDYQNSVWSFEDVAQQN
jgi:hypothetical protein